MTLTCTRCSRVNPAEAVYCYHDGAALDGAAAAARPAAAGAFATPFVFPSGRTCRAFDELAQACMADWAGARDLLRQGFLERFLGGLGRADLAQAAREAAGFPDPDRGLDQFLARLPAATVQPPRLQVSPGELNLGTVTIGTRRQFELRLDNQGQRLLYGAVASDSPWLTLGEGPGSAQKLFQTLDQAAIPVQLHGEHLRAGTRPLEARLTIESNGGTRAVTVQAQVPVQPFPAGALAGAISPRQLAEKARAAPKEAAALFETGAVAHWYERNGWTYPVPGPAASGIAAVQQFFEALGLTRPPKVEVSERALSLKGAAGERLHRALQVRTAEKRPVFAHARSDQPWLVVGQVQHQGPAAFIPLAVTAPPQTGQLLEARVTVTANGNQRFVIPVTLAVEGQAVAAAPAAGPRRVVVPRRPRRPVWQHAVPAAVLLLALGGVAIADLLRDNTPAPVEVAVHEDRVEEKKAPVVPVISVAVEDEPEQFVEGAKPPPAQVSVVDEPEVREPVVLPVKVEFKDEPQEGGGPGKGDVPVDDRPVVHFQYGGRGRFGLIDARSNKRLTFSPNGGTNTCVIGVDKATAEVGAGAPEQINDLPADPLRPAQVGTKSVWAYGGVELTQVYQLVPSKLPVDVGGVQKRLVDTLLVRYTITNRDRRAHNVGLRNQVDTLIGGNDGVPFTVPGLRGLVDTFHDFKTPKSVPEFIQALEVANLQAPGTVAHMTLKVGGGLEPPSRVSLTRWPGGNLSWNIPVVHMSRDSAVILYWNAKSLPPGKSREFGFAYGLGSVTASEGTGKLGVTLSSGDYDPGKSFTVTAYVGNPVLKQTVTLELPPGLERIEGEASQPAAAGGQRNATVILTWRVKVQRTGVFRLKVRSSTGQSQTKTITIARPEGPTGGNFTLHLSGDFQPGQSFRVEARVKEPEPGQSLTLRLPPGLQRFEGGEVEPVPPAKGLLSTVAWKVKVTEVGKHPVRVQSSTGVTQTKTVLIARADPTAGRVALKLAGTIAPGKDFSVAAQVTNPLPGQTLTLGLELGLRLVEGRETETVPAGQDGVSGVTWKVRVAKAGKHGLSVRSSTGITLKKSLIIDEKRAEGGGHFVLKFEGKIEPGKDFTVAAKVTKPAPGQRLTLTLPEGLKLEEGEATQDVPLAAEAVVRWRLRVAGLGRLPVRVASSTGVTRTSVLTLSATDSSGGPAVIFGR
jgi:hypothetical protein